MPATTKLIVASLLGVTMLAGIPMSAYAQDDKDKKVTLDLEQVDVREALRALFKSTGLSYSIAPEVQGIVTVNLKDVSFEAALQNVLKQCNATYRVTGGVYEIINRQEIIVPPPSNDPGVPKTDNKVHRRVHVNSADPMFIAFLIAKENTNFTAAPEMSTVIKTPGGNSGGFGGFGGGGQGNGFNGNNGFNGGNNNRNGGGNNNRGGGGGGFGFGG